jgi:hypothetical protein
VGSAPKLIARCATLLIALASGCSTNLYAPSTMPANQSIAYPAPQRELPTALPLHESLTTCDVIAADDDLPTVVHASPTCEAPDSCGSPVAEQPVGNDAANLPSNTVEAVANPFRNRTVEKYPSATPRAEAIPAVDPSASEGEAENSSSIDNPFRTKRIEAAQKTATQDADSTEPAPLELPRADDASAANDESPEILIEDTQTTSYFTDMPDDEDRLPLLIAAQNFASTADAQPIAPSNCTVVAESPTTSAAPPELPPLTEIVPPAVAPITAPPEAPIVAAAPPVRPLALEPPLATSPANPEIAQPVTPATFAPAIQIALPAEQAVASLPGTAYAMSPGEPAKAYLLIPVESLPQTPPAAEPTDHFSVLQPDAQAPSPLLPLFLEPAPLPTTHAEPVSAPAPAAAPETIVETVAEEAWVRPQLPVTQAKNDQPRVSDRVARHMSNNLAR